MTTTSARGVTLPEGHTGSSYFHKVLSDTAEEYGDALQAARLPESPGAFKAGYGDALTRFEVARIQSPERVAIARTVAVRTQSELRFDDGQQKAPLDEYLAGTVPPPRLQTIAFGDGPGLSPAVPFEGRIFRGSEIRELIGILNERHCLSEAAEAGLCWIVDHAQAAGGRLDLRGQRFALMGAGAELAPTELLQRAGAEVLWIDIADPASSFASRPGLAGNLHYAPEASNLLLQPREVAASIESFAQGHPVHLGMFAYAAGASQEWRLGASMNAIVRSLDPAHVASVAMFVSPTTVGSVYPRDQHVAALRMDARPAWQRAMQGVGGLAAPGQAGDGDLQVSRAVVSVQGVSYQAAQYVSKLAAAETYAVYGTDLRAKSPRPITVSCNVAGITRTRSLAHPVFQAAFIGAPAFGVQIFDPDTTRALSGLLVLHDLLNPDAPGSGARVAPAPDKARALLSQQVHGGVYSLPMVLESAIRVAALIGMAKKPTVLVRRRNGAARQPSAPA